MNRDVPKGLMIISILVGLIFFLGPTTYKIINRYMHRDYVETTATFIQLNEAGTSDNGTSMYSLVYTYVVNGQQYYYETDYSTSVIPKIGSEIRIKYNPIMPNEAYSNSFNAFNVFQIVGAFFLSISLIILFSDMIWLRDLIIFLFTAGFIITFLINKFYNGGFIIAIIIFGIMCFASVMDFITYLKNNKFQPMRDIKKEIEISKKIKQKKKDERINQTQEDKERKNKKIKRIKIAILLFLTMPLYIFIEVKGLLPNETLYTIVCIISVFCFFAGFCILGLTLVGAFDDKDYIVTIAGKRINNKDIKK